MLLLHSDDEDNVYVGVDKEVVYGPGDDDDVVHEEGGLDNVERLHHCRKVEVRVEGVCELLLGESSASEASSCKPLSLSS